MTPKFQKERDAVIKAALRHVAFDGWTVAALARGAKDAKIKTPVETLFPRGATQAVAHFSDWADRKSLENVQEKQLAKMRVRDRIAHCVRLRLSFLAPHRAAVSAASLSPVTPRSVWRTADRIWWTAGDTSTDYNHYTKRLLLSGVLASTTLYWLNDASGDEAATSAFLDRRLDEVMKVGQALSRLRRPAA